MFNNYEPQRLQLFPFKSSEYKIFQRKILFKNEKAQKRHQHANKTNKYANKTQLNVNFQKFSI